MDRSTALCRQSCHAYLSKELLAMFHTPLSRYCMWVSHHSTRDHQPCEKPWSIGKHVVTLRANALQRVTVRHHFEELPCVDCGNRCNIALPMLLQKDVLPWEARIARSRPLGSAIASTKW